MSAGLVIKPLSDVDEYVLWSLMAEGPIFVGTRREMLAFLGPAVDGQATVPRLDRADRTGTSSVLLDGGFGDYMIFQQRGIVDCSRLGKLSRLVLAGEYDAALDLCRPFDGEEAVRRG